MRQHVGGTVVVALCCMLLTAPRRAEAICSTQEVSVPADGATVPPNLTRYWFTSSASRDVRISGPGGAVALNAPIYHFRGLVEIQLVEPLLPNTDYLVELIDANNNVRRSTFHTSNEADRGAPPAPVISDIQAGAARLDMFGGENLREGVFLLSAQTSLDADVPVFEVSAQKEGDARQPVLVAATSNLRASSSLCANVVVYVPGNSSACITVTAIDYAGRRSIPTTACTSVRNCGSVDSYSDSLALDLFTCAEPDGCNAGRSSNGTTGLVTFALVAFAGIVVRRRR